MPRRKLEQRIRELLASGLQPELLREAIEPLAQEQWFPAYTWLWGPALYRAHRVVFLPFILSHWGWVWEHRRRVWRGDSGAEAGGTSGPHSCAPALTARTSCARCRACCGRRISTRRWSANACCGCATRPRSAAVRVLSQIPAFAIRSYARLLRQNRLARILFERSLPGFLQQPRQLVDLVEAPEIHVQALAYRVLALDDDRARAAARDNLDVLLGTLLRPLHRRTRAAAFGALANAAHDPAAAQRIATRARQAFDLPDMHYPKERLLGLLGAVLHRHPQLRTEQEQPLVYRRAR